MSSRVVFIWLAVSLNGERVELPPNDLSEYDSFIGNLWENQPELLHHYFPVLFMEAIATDFSLLPPDYENVVVESDFKAEQNRAIRHWDWWQNSPIFHQSIDPDYVVLGDINETTVGKVDFLANDGKVYQFSDANLLGSGNFSNVYKASEKGNAGHAIVVKRICHDTSQTGYGDEIGALRAMGQFMGEHGRLIGMTHFEGQTLRVVLGKSSVLLAYRMQLRDSLEKQLLYLHEKGYVHRDVTVDNVIVRDRKAYLVDYSLALNRSMLQAWDDWAARDLVMMNKEFLLL